ncbi:hypothetical protein [Labrys sp. ZIDIC5]|uniref:hypothetical protein n=1 Tax=Labrys sedimenti TaxID=3106036 RepID=UPI002ACA29A8|nr:hypothetical protein [Labrys sp. ZIDIC5]MDZ5454545.1 hypothetical protein [Labrys sp. ZIDIC5]
MNILARNLVVAAKATISRVPSEAETAVLEQCDPPAGEIPLTLCFSVLSYSKDLSLFGSHSRDDVRIQAMNSPGGVLLEKAVLALLLPKIGYFSDHAVVTRTMPISLWREHMQSAIQAYLAAAAVERKSSRSRKSRERKLSVGKGEMR